MGGDVKKYIVEMGLGMRLKGKLCWVYVWSRVVGIDRLCLRDYIRKVLV